ncbi:CdaR family protein [Desertibacillus haloalkaliphilus]|uniref:CdaR family protein n=1 Tax=Desertibacillus haloalkaliphilus TaxID=1328930 RepID=UPI001C26D9F2|nr:CdaR family protein [Desertibacillus haloalkaliphilus]MBU8908803.1 YbbR-like domain-containing protein [Desertibacillus haloalkaliphilus]
MDKLFNSPWFVKIISFFIALMLFLMVNMDNFNNQPGGVLPRISDGSYTLEEVELSAYYDEENYEITEITETVQVNLRGPQSVLTMLQVTRPAFDVYVDLRDREAGVHHVSIQHDGFPNQLSVSIAPQFVRVVLQDKKTISIPVEVDLVNEGEVAEGYSIGEPIVTPVNVEITAAEEWIDQVAKVKAYVDVKDADKTIEQGVPVKIYDHVGNELQLDVEPSVVDVKVPITSPHTDVPVKVTRVGELPEGLSVDSLTVDPKEVRIFGPQDIINAITVIDGLELDLDEITEDQTVELEVPKPTGVERVDPEKVNVTVELNEQESLGFYNIPVEISGLVDGYRVNFESEAGRFIDVVVKGTETVLSKIIDTDIQAYIDVNELSLGEHVVPIQINGPQDLSFETDRLEAVITIEEVENE